jgi:L-amino acid N-acyltransferase YncA
MATRFLARRQLQSGLSYAGSIALHESLGFDHAGTIK